MYYTLNTCHKNFDSDDKRREFIFLLFASSSLSFYQHTAPHLLSPVFARQKIFIKNQLLHLHLNNHLDNYVEFYTELFCCFL